MKKHFGRKNKLRVVLVPPLQDHRLLPLGAGLLKASALADPFIRERAEITIIEPVGTPEETASRVCRLRPHLAGFTLYGDITLTKKAAAGIRRGCGAVIVFGGPAVGDGTPRELFSGGGADYAVAGEAERSFPSLLRSMLGRGDIDSVKGLSRLEGDQVRLNPPEPPPADLEALPSPHLRGLFRWPGYLRMVLEMSRGCREGCLYCCISRKTRSFDLPRVRAELKKIMDGYPEARTIFLADPDVCQGPRMTDLLRMLAGAVTGREMTVEIQVAPRRLNRVSIPLFNDRSFNLGIGVQSVSPETCRLVNRRLDLADLEAKLKLLAAEAPRAKITLSFITGLPGDTFEKALRSFDWALSVNAGAYFHRLSVYPGTPLSRAADRLGIKYQPRYPYHSVSTPAMGKKELARAMAEAARLSLPANLVFADKHLGFLFRYIAKGREKNRAGLPRLELARRLDRLARRIPDLAEAAAAVDALENPGNWSELDTRLPTGARIKLNSGLSAMEEGSAARRKFARRYSVFCRSRLEWEMLDGGTMNRLLGLSGAAAGGARSLLLCGAASSDPARLSSLGFAREMIVEEKFGFYPSRTAARRFCADRPGLSRSVPAALKGAAPLELIFVSQILACSPAAERASILRSLSRSAARGARLVIAESRLGYPEFGPDWELTGGWTECRREDVEAELSGAGWRHLRTTPVGEWNIFYSEKA